MDTEDRIIELKADKIGQAFANLRRNRGLTQSELARRTGMRQPAIFRLENGKHIPTWRTLVKVAQALDAEITVDLIPGGIAE